MMNKKSGLIYDFRTNWKSYIFVLPVVLGVLIFSLYPIISSLFYSFTDYNIAYPPYNFGVQNYVKAFTTDFAKVGKSIGITLVYTVISVPVNMLLSFGLALLLNRAAKGVGVFRVLFYTPVIIPGIVVSLLWVDIVDPVYGIANAILQAIGLPTSKFIYDPSTALATVIVIGFWNIGANMILWLSALKNVSNELKEAARLDGAGSLKTLLHVTIPMCTPTIFYILVTSSIAALQTFGVYFMTGGGGTDDSLLFFGVKIYLEAFRSTRFGYACALSWIMFVIVGLVSCALFKSNRWVYYED